MKDDLPARIERYLSETERKPLTAAVRAGDVDAVHSLLSRLSPLQKTIRVNERDKAFFEWTPLLVACTYKPNLEIIQLLIEAGADVNAKDSQGDTPLLKAVQAAAIAAVNLLLQNGAEVTPEAIEVADSSGLIPIATLLLYS